MNLLKQKKEVEEGGDKQLIIRLLLVFFFFFLLACNSSNNPKRNYLRNHNGYIITKEGYYFFDDYQLYIRETKNGSIIYAMQDKNNNILIPSNIFMPFSNYQKWLFYIDSNNNIWHLNSDLQEYLLWYKSEEYKKRHDYKKENISPPIIELKW